MLCFGFSIICCRRTATETSRTTFLFAFSSLSRISFLFFYAFLRPLAFSVVLPICLSHFTSSNYRLLYGLIPPRFPLLCSSSCSHSFANPPAHFCRVLFNFWLYLERARFALNFSLLFSTRCSCKINVRVPFLIFNTVCRKPIPFLYHLIKKAEQTQHKQRKRCTIKYGIKNKQTNLFVWVWERAKVWGVCNELCQRFILMDGDYRLSQL